jgi:carbamoyl-phosphate synthase small subunit
MSHGHHGANHPVKELASGRVMITSQNHGFAVDGSSLPDVLEATHVSLFDESLQGLRHREAPAFGFQGHPEASPGPQDAESLFDDFVELMASARGN